MFTKLKRQWNIFYKGALGVVLIAFLSSSVCPAQKAYAQTLNLPVPGTMVKMTRSFMPALVKGIKIDPNNPLQFEFLIDPGQTPLSQEQKKEEYRKLVKYFLASLTTPEKEMWVNLSPYEHSRIISKDFGNTEMGRDMLAQDYILKQLAASLVYPEDDLGKKFWNKIYERVRMETGNAKIPVNTFNKVWIIPDKATVFEKGNVAIVTQSHLKVLMAEDYEALSKHVNVGTGPHASPIASQTIREIVIPAIETEVNEGKNFAQLRQMYNSMILASWFKQRLKMHLLSRIYVNKNKDQGVELQDPQENEKIFQRYVQAYKKGVYNYIKEDPDPISGQMIPRKYFSGGVDAAALARPIAATGFDQTQGIKIDKNPPVFTGPLDSAMVSLFRFSTGSSPRWAIGLLLTVLLVGLYTNVDARIPNGNKQIYKVTKLTALDRFEIGEGMVKNGSNVIASELAGMSGSLKSISSMGGIDIGQFRKSILLFDVPKSKKGDEILKDLMNSGFLSDTSSNKVDFLVLIQDHQKQVLEILRRYCSPGTAKSILQLMLREQRLSMTNEEFVPTIASSGNKAQLTNGGIDFNDQYLQMNRQGDGNVMMVPAGFEWLLNSPIEGFAPQILDIRSGVGFELSFFKGLLSSEQRREAKP